MATLRSNIAPRMKEIRIDGDVSLAKQGHQYRIDDEIITLRSFVRDLSGTGASLRDQWYVTRGDAGTGRRSHTAGTELFAVAPAVVVSDSLALPMPYTGESSGGELNYLDTILADSPVVIYTMDETSGNLTDDVGGKTGTVNGNPTYGNPGPVIGFTAIDFDGTGDYVSVADHADIDLGNGPFTLEVWLKRDGISTFQSLFCKQSNDTYLLRIDDTDHVILTSVAVGNALVDAVALSDTTSWHHIVATWDNTSPNSKLYIDGVDRSATFTSRTFIDANAALTIGSDGGSTPVNGRMAMVAIYKTTLSAARVLAHYDAATAGLTITDTNGTPYRITVSAPVT